MPAYQIASNVKKKKKTSWEQTPTVLFTENWSQLKNKTGFCIPLQILDVSKTLGNRGHTILFYGDWKTRMKQLFSQPHCQNPVDFINSDILNEFEGEGKGLWIILILSYLSIVAPNLLKDFLFLTYIHTDPAVWQSLFSSLIHKSIAGTPRLGGNSPRNIKVPFG